VQVQGGSVRAGRWCRCGRRSQPTRYRLQQAGRQAEKEEWQAGRVAGRGRNPEP